MWIRSATARPNVHCAYTEILLSTVLQSRFSGLFPILKLTRFSSAKPKSSINHAMSVVLIKHLLIAVFHYWIAATRSDRADGKYCHFLLCTVHCGHTYMKSFVDANTQNRTARQAIETKVHMWTMQTASMSRCAWQFWHLKSSIGALSDHRKPMWMAIVSIVSRFSILSQFQ